MKLALAALAWALVTLVRASVAGATGLTIETIEHGAWGSSVESLQRDLASQGAVLHVYVTDETGRHAPCDEYTLTLDAVTAAAFTIEACDSSTHATTLRLVRRDALFVPAVPVWRPASAGLRVVEVRHGAVAGGAHDDAHGEVHCSLAVRPYITDLHDGRQVYLTPEGYTLRLLRADASVEAQGQGWTLHADAAGRVDLAYEIVDRSDDHVVLHETASLVCAQGEGVVNATPGVRFTPAEAWRALATAPASPTPDPLYHRPFAQFHFDLFMLHYNSVDLTRTPLYGSMGGRTGQQTGITGAASFGFTPYTAPHFGLGVEIPSAAFTVEGGYLPFGWGTGPGDAGGAQLGFIRLIAAARVSTGALNIALGPNLDAWWVMGGHGTGWNTDGLVMAGVTAEIRIRATGHGRHDTTPSLGYDNFIRFTEDFIGGGGWMIAWGQSWGGPPGQ